MDQSHYTFVIEVVESKHTGRSAATVYRDLDEMGGKRVRLASSFGDHPLDAATRAMEYARNKGSLR
jgi:hypothetical protein